MSDSNRGIACDFTALPEDQRDRHRAVARTLFESVDDVEERPDGYAFLLPATTETISRAGQFISLERLCCPFFRFGLEVEPKHGSARLTLSGREDVKSFLEDTLLSEWDL